MEKPVFIVMALFQWPVMETGLVTTLLHWRAVATGLFMSDWPVHVCLWVKLGTVHHTQAVARFAFHYWKGGIQRHAFVICKSWWYCMDCDTHPCKVSNVAFLRVWNWLRTFLATLSESLMKYCQIWCLLVRALKVKGITHLAPYGRGADSTLYHTGDLPPPPPP